MYVGRISVTNPFCRQWSSGYETHAIFFYIFAIRVPISHRLTPLIPYPLFRGVDYRLRDPILYRGSWIRDPWVWEQVWIRIRVGIPGMGIRIHIGAWECAGTDTLIYTHERARIRYMYVRTHEDTHTAAKYNPYIFLMSAGEGCESVSVCGTTFYRATLQTYA